MGKIQMKRKDYEQKKKNLSEIAALQNHPNPPGEVIIAKTDILNTVDEWLAHDYEENFEMYLDKALLMTLRDKNGNYIYSPIKNPTSSEEKELMETRKFLEEILRENLEII